MRNKFRKINQHKVVKHRIIVAAISIAALADVLKSEKTSFLKNSKLDLLSTDTTSSPESIKTPTTFQVTKSMPEDLMLTEPKTEPELKISSSSFPQTSSSIATNIDTSANPNTLSTSEGDVIPAPDSGGDAISGSIDTGGTTELSSESGIAGVLGSGLAGAASGGGGSNQPNNDTTFDDSTTTSAPSINSDGGGETANLSVDENQALVTNVESSDPDGDSEGSGLSYSLTGGDDQALFNIDANTGVLSFNVVPDFENPNDNDTNNIYEVQVTVTDSEGLNDTQTIIISINDVNEGAPTITSSASNSVAENQTNAIDVNTSDSDDSEGSGLTYAITGGTDQALFSINSNTGVVTFNNAPDFENPGDANADNNYELIVTVTDSGGLTDTQNITVTVTDANDAPIITSSATNAVPENQTTAIDVNTQDQDGDTEGSGLTYAITGGADQALFSINSNTGVVTFNSAPDSENPSDANADNNYELIVTVTDSGGLTNNQTITITVTDANDAPTITSSATNSVSENQTGAIDINTQDQDGDTEGSGLTYAITGGADQALFSINSNTGVVTFNNAPGFENPSDANADNNYELIVTVTDSGGLTDTQNITVTVTNANDAPTITSSATNSVSENQTGAIDVNSQDQDGDTEASGLTYALSGGADQALFSINSNTGVVTFNSAPDFENPDDANADNNYELIVTVTDSGGLTDTQNITVTVTDGNDAPTITSSATNSVPENQTSAIDVNTQDQDSDTEGSGLTYAITGGADQALFSINSNTGVVTFNSAPDFENPDDANADNNYELIVTVTDSGGLTNNQTITITVTDANDAPTITSSATNSVAENQTSAIDVNSQDQDGDTESSGLTYALTGGADQALFSINSNTGVVTFNNAPDFENPADANADNNYELIVTVTDSGGLTNNQTITITVTDANDAPTITSSATNSVLENQTGAVDVNSQDQDGDTEGSGLTYALTGGADQALFSINSNTGVVTFNSAPGFENPGDANADNNYELTVTVTDSGGLTDTQNITVTVTDGNDAPTITSSATNAVPENQTTAIDVNTQDQDGDTEGSGLTYVITGGADQALFSINSNTGVVTFNNAPGFENPGDANADNNYELIVTVTDSGGLTDTQNITVTVTDGNDAPTITSSATNTVPENQTTAIDVNTQDQDGDTEGSGLTYALSGGADVALFSINSNTGVVTFNNAPDFENPSDANADNNYELIVTVTDSGGLTDTQTITITVTDANDAPTITSLATNSVAENQTSAIDVNSQDQDGDTEGSGLTYALSGGADVALFSINSNTGVVTFNSAPDFENLGDANADNNYELIVTVTDSGGLTDTQNITVTVTDANDAPIITSLATNSVAENQTGAVDVNSQDQDGDTEGSGLTYALTGGADQALFSINSNTGVVTFNSAPDFENPDDANADNNYELIVTVTDSGGLTDNQTITITVTDANDAPTITSSATNSVAENQTSAIDVNSQDQDGDTESSGLTYALTGGADQALFSINSNTGVVTFNNAPDFENPADANADNNYELIVTVTDSGGLTNNQTITITVTDANDAPTITSSATNSVLENQTGAVDVNSQDQDGDTEGSGLTYALTGGADQALFSINSNTGVVTFNSAPDFENPGDANADNNYEFIITVTDSGGLTDTQNITVTVTDANDAPIITSLTTNSVAENQTGAIDVNTQDQDGDTEGSGLTYALTGGADQALFSINSNTGVVTFNSAPDFENPSDANADNNYELIVTVTDSGGLTDTQNITVTVTDANDAPTITSLATNSVAENQTSAIDVNTQDQDGDTEGSGLTYALTGGADQALFSINSNTGVVTFNSAPEFENPDDANADNNYELIVTVTDSGGLTDTQNITVTVTDANDAPIITSLTTNSVAENQTSAIDVNTQDQDGDTEGSGLTYVITGGADQALFSINSNTGVVTFNSAPDFENPSDANADNNYELIVTVTDSGGLTDTQNITVTVTDANDAPTITSSATNAVPENQTGAIDVNTQDQDGDTEGSGLTYTLSGGADVALFSINSNTGVVTFNSAPDSENPGDANADNNYELIVTVTDSGGLTDTQNITVTVTDGNDAPTITSSATNAVPENQTTAIDVNTQDQDGDTEGSGLTYAITGGADQALFSINSNTGVVTFNSAPDSENPGDANADNNYELIVTVSDSGGLTDTQNITVTVTDGNDAPTITSSATNAVPENQTTAIDVNTQDQEGDTEASGLTYALSGGADVALFSINSNTGVVTFNNAPDFENPSDANADNNYELIVTVTDSGGLTDTQTITITVTDANDAPTITSLATNSVAENQTSAIDVNSQDQEGDTEGSGLTYVISGGADQALFSINSNTGVVTFNSAPDFENPSDANADNNYELIVTVTDSGGLTDTQNITVTVTDGNDAPTITSSATNSVPENQTNVIDVNTQDQDGDTEASGLTYALSGGADVALFSINSNTGVVTFNNAPDFENPSDANADNNYELIVTVTDSGGLTDTQNITVTVTDANDAPIITSTTNSVAENQTSAIDVNTQDQDGDTEGSGLTYALTGGADQALFSINSNTGVVTFNSAPDFENPGDANADNDYEVQVTVTDSGGLTDTQSITVTVTDVNEAPVIVSFASTPTVELSSLDGTNGFVINGVSAGDRTGRSVSDAGDINGDGIADFIIGTFITGAETGAAYVVFGSTNAFSGTLELSSLDGTNGFTLRGIDAGDIAGFSVSNAGDINGDGIDDIIIGARLADPNGLSSGEAYVVFGSTGAFSASFELSSLNGTNGFTLNGINTGDQSGIFVSNAGDVNGDGIDDVLIGARYAAPNGSSSGAAYVVFGSTAAFGTTFELSSLNGSNGFTINGTAVTNRTDRVNNLGDINGDGVDDLIIGARYADPNGADSGQSYVIFGNTSGFGATLELSGLDGSNGFTINGISAGDNSGRNVEGIGDFNGDGINDFIINADEAASSAGESYVIYGSTAGFGAVLELSSLNGTNGFTLTGIDVDDFSGLGLASADINGDGLIDLILGAPAGDPNALDSGETYVIFGSMTSFGATFALSDIDGTNGFILNGIDNGDRSGADISNVGDINGDGLDDFIIGARFGDPNGDNSGESYIIFGSDIARPQVDEGTTAVINVNATDTEGDTEGSGLTYAISGGTDQAFFNINSNTGELSFVSAPDFENPSDANADNNYEVSVTVTDSGGLTDTQVMVVSVTDVNETAPTITSFSTTPTFELSSLNGSNGFTLNGIDANDQAGFGVSNAGDVNGDGIDDILIGARFADPNGTDSGEAYVVFGSTAGFSATIELSALNGSNGFTINGIDAYDAMSAFNLSTADVNDDGISDLLLSAELGDTNGADSGEAYVVFGNTAGFSATLELSDLNGSNGFVLNGIDADDQAGLGISNAGDLNGDGIEDIAIGARFGDPNGSDAGETYIVFGSTDAFSASIELSSLNGTNGFIINGVGAEDQSGREVSNAGDVNGDGISDLLISAFMADPNGADSGQSYVVFGSTSGFGSSVELSSLDGTNGFAINGIDAGDQAGHALSDAGDLNGDGIDDIIIGARFADPNSNTNAGETYVIFGSTAGFGATLELSSLNGTNGFTINGIDAYDEAGHSVSNAGDVNGDGIDDLLIGARFADPNGSNSGESYIVFGRTDGFSATLDLSDLDGTNGYVLNGISNGDQAGRFSSTAGDVNNDGIDDLIIGAFRGDPNGGNSGEAYVLFGSNVAQLFIDENTTAVVDIDAADDIDSEGSGLVYSISGGADQALFGINTSTGELSFLAAPDFEVPGDADAGNDYEVQVTVTDSDAQTDSLDIVVNVEDVSAA